MTNHELTGTTAIITGASRGFGRAAAVDMASRGALVVGVARDGNGLEQVRDEVGEAFIPETADVADPSLPGRLISTYRPRFLVLNAGATPPALPISEHTWDTFAINWNVDVKHVFHFVRQALTTPLDRGSSVVSLSSGAAIGGSPMSGSYAGAKATIRFISGYAGMEAQQRHLGIRFVAVLPQLTTATDLGRTYAGVYASQAGMAEDEFLEARGGRLSLQTAGRSLADLVTDPSYGEAAYMLGPQGLRSAV